MLTFGSRLFISKYPLEELYAKYSQQPCSLVKGIRYCFKTLTEVATAILKLSDDFETKTNRKFGIYLIK